MAFPVVEATNESSTNTAGTTHTVNLPSGIQANDLLLVLLDKGSTAATVNALTGWTELIDQNSANGLYAAYRWADGNEGATITLTTSASTRSAEITYRISGAQNPATTPPILGSVGVGTSATPDPGNCDPAAGAKDYLWVAFFGQAGEELDDDTWVNTPPSNFTPSPPLQKACGTAGANLGGKIGAASRQFNAASLDAGSFGVDVSAAYNAVTIAVPPIPAQPQTINGGVASEADAALGGTIRQPQPPVSGGKANESDGAPSGTVDQVPTGILDRRFDGSDDEINFSVGQASLTGAISVAALMRFNGSSGSIIVAHLQSTAVRWYVSSYDNGGGVIRVSMFINAVARQMTTGIIPFGEWVRVGVSKAADTATPRGHLWTPSGGWVHGDMDGTLGNPTTAQTAIQIGHFSTFAHYANDYAVLAEWNSVLSDADFESLFADPESQNFEDLNPVAGWNFNQASVATPVTDWTGGGADQSSITGTTVDDNGPAGWDYDIAGPQTIQGGVASEADAALGGTIRQPQPPVAGGVASEADSATAGTIRQPQPPVVGGVATEADSAVAGTIIQPQAPVAGGVASEADAAPSGTIRQPQVPVSGGVASEADSAPAGSVQQGAPQTIEGGVASEADSAPGGTVQIGTAQTIQGGVAPESDTAPGGTIIHPQAPVAGGVAAEADAAVAGTIRQPQPPVSGGVAAESDIARGGTIRQPQPPVVGGVASEADSVLAGVVINPTTIAAGVASEQDAAVGGSVIMGEPTVPEVAIWIRQTKHIVQPDAYTLP